MSNFLVKNLRAKVEKKEILKGISFKMNPSELHVVMGPNGSGKSTLVYALAGHPNYKLMKNSEIYIDKKSLVEMSPDERAREGLFLGFQNPVSISGVSVQKLLWTAFKTINPKTKKKIIDFRKEMLKKARDLGISEELLGRSINEGFSGGERKKLEMLQLLILEPKYAILDEVDSGLDIDAIKMVAKGIKQAREKYRSGILLITHYQRILKYLNPTCVYVLVEGKFIKKGGVEVVREVEAKGYRVS